MEGVHLAEEFRLVVSEDDGGQPSEFPSPSPFSDDEDDLPDVSGALKALNVHNRTSSPDFPDLSIGLQIPPEPAQAGTEHVPGAPPALDKERPDWDGNVFKCASELNVFAASQQKQEDNTDHQEQTDIERGSTDLLDFKLNSASLVSEEKPGSTVFPHVAEDESGNLVLCPEGKLSEEPKLGDPVIQQNTVFLTLGGEKSDFDQPSSTILKNEPEGKWSEEPKLGDPVIQQNNISLTLGGENSDFDQQSSIFPKNEPEEYQEDLLEELAEKCAYLHDLNPQATAPPFPSEKEESSLDNAFIERLPDDTNVYDKQPEPEGHDETVHGNKPVTVSPPKTSKNFATGLSEEQLRQVWELAQKLCEARCTYNKDVCRPLSKEDCERIIQRDRVEKRSWPSRSRFAPLASRRPWSWSRPRRAGAGHAPRRAPARPRPTIMMNRCALGITGEALLCSGGTSRIGKGRNWEDPDEWDWDSGEPVPEEILKVLRRTNEDTPAVICLSDDDSPPSSSNTCEEIKVIADGEITLSDDDLPDVSAALRTLHKEQTPSPDITDVGLRLLHPAGGSSALGNVSPPPSSAVLPVTCPTIDMRSRGRTVPLKKRLVVPPAQDEPNSVSVISVPCSTVTFTENRRRRCKSLLPEVKEVVCLSSSSDDDEVEMVKIKKRKTSVVVPVPPSPAQTVTDKQEEPPKSVWSCPICMETKEKVGNLMSTNCGHVFCETCIRSSITLNKQCPTCRRRLTARQIHKLFM